MGDAFAATAAEERIPLRCEYFGPIGTHRCRRDPSPIAVLAAHPVRPLLAGAFKVLARSPEAFRWLNALSFTCFPDARRRTASRAAMSSCGTLPGSSV